MKRIAAVFVLAALSLAAQDSKQGNKDEPSKVLAQKLFVLKYADPGQVGNLLRALGAVNINEASQMRAIAVTAEQHAMAVIEDAIKQLDVPSAMPKDVELTGYFLVGSDAETSAGAAVPKELETVVAQLKNTFPFKSYRQMDVIEARTRTGDRVEANSRAALTLEGQPKAAGTSLHVSAVVLAEDGLTVRLDGLVASVRVMDTSADISLRASVDVKEGQRVVVGRIGLGHDQALFLVLTAHVDR